jgi:hypothetical protein
MTAATANVPFMITQAMKAKLRGLGYTDAQIRQMTPEKAWRLLDAADPAPAHAGHSTRHPPRRSASPA